MNSNLRQRKEADMQLIITKELKRIMDSHNMYTSAYMVYTPFFFEPYGKQPMAEKNRPELKNLFKMRPAFVVQLIDAYLQPEEKDALIRQTIQQRGKLVAQALMTRSALTLHDALSFCVVFDRTLEGGLYWAQIAARDNGN